MAADDNDFTPVRIPAKEVLPPVTISPAARRNLSTGAGNPRMNWPPASDKEAWRRHVANVDPAREALFTTMLEGVKTPIETTQIGGVPCFDCIPSGHDPAAGPVYLFVHGGAFVAGGGVFAKAVGGRAADMIGARVVSVDYRMPPEDPFPAAPQDCLAVYRALIETVDPARIVVGGSSAGGNIAASTILMIRDLGLPLPAGAVLLTPEVDLTESGDTFVTNAELDVILKGGLPDCNAIYADGHDLTDPYLSPLFADYTKGFPPTLVQSGTRDLFLSNSVLLHRKLRDAGIEAELHVWEAMPHGGFLLGDVPENAEIQVEVARFIRRVAG